MSLPLDGRISACLKGHSQLNESDVGLVPHGDVGAAVCNSNLLRECILLVTQVNSNTRGGWKVLNKEVVDGLQDCVVSCVVPSLLQGIGAGIEDVDQGLTLAAQIAGWGWQLLPHVQVSIVREGVGEGVQGKLEDSLREGHNCGRPQAGSSAGVVLQWLVLDN